LVKIPIKLIIDNNSDLKLDTDQQQEYLIKQSNSLLFDQIERIRGSRSLHISEFILVEAKKNPKLQDKLECLLNDGFYYNGFHYVRFGKSASQGKDGITAFINIDYYEELYMITQMDITIDECVISKYEAQRCLVFSNCTLIPDYIPNIVIIGEYEKVLKNQWIKYVVEKKKEFIDKDTGNTKKYKAREIEEGYHDIPLSPFDGFGCHEESFMEITSAILGLDYNAIGSQIRMPFIKGFSVYVPFKEIFAEMEVTEITDIYGIKHNVNSIDCIWNTSMFKGHKIFNDKYGSDAWNQYMNTFKKYNFKLGISKYSHHVKDLNLMSKMNFQYLQCLDLWNPKYIENYENKSDVHYDILDEKNHGKIINLANYSTNLFQKIISGDKFYTYKFLGISDTEDYDADSRYVEAALINDNMLHDMALKKYLHQKLKKSINQMKYGKIYVEGFYHTLVGDIIGYLEYAAGKEVVGCLKEKEFYCDTLPKGKVLSFRSPLVCPSEVNDVNLVENDMTQKWLSHFKNQDIVMTNMYDLSLPQQGGADQDGDSVYLCNNPIIIDAKIDKPIIIDIEDKATAHVKKYNKQNITEYELNSRDNRIGEITNVATSIENKYASNPELKKVYEDFASLLRVFQGKEIDFLKTGLRWQMNKGLRKYLKQLPLFLLYNYPQKLSTYYKLKQKNKKIEDPKDKIKLNGYRSPSPMNELCDYINAWERKNILWDNTVYDTRCLIMDSSIDVSDKAKMRQVKHLINKFAVEWREKIREKEHKNSNGDSDDMNLDLVIEKYKGKLSEIENDERILSNYVIAASYSNGATNKTLVWKGYGDYIIENLKRSTPLSRHTTIEEVPYKTSDTYEYLGKYYKMIEVENV